MNRWIWKLCWAYVRGGPITELIEVCENDPDDHREVIRLIKKAKVCYRARCADDLARPPQ